jgi:hypothetical protein
MRISSSSKLLALVTTLVTTVAITSAQAQVVLGAHTLLGQEQGAGVSPAITAAINTQTSGSVLLAFNAGYASNNRLPTDNKGNLWTPFGTPVIYQGYNGVFDVKAYIVNSAVGGSGHQVSVVKNGDVTGELTLAFVEVRQARLQDSAQTYAAAAPIITSGTVRTTGPATLVGFWWGDGASLQHTAVPGSGFSIIEQFLSLPPNSAVQAAIAVRQVNAAGGYNLSWTQTPSQGSALWLFAFQSPDTLMVHGFAEV